MTKLNASAEETGDIIATFGRHYEVSTNQQGTPERIQCVPKGKKSVYACGDRVQFRRTSAHQGVISGVMDRKNLLWRSDAFREKLIAANLDLVVIVAATEPAFSDLLVSRCLAAAEHEHIDAIIVLNKTDLVDRLPEARRQLEPFVSLGYPCVELSALSGPDSLLPLISHRSSILVGQSGMGKSTLINALIPEARAATREISTALDSGKHTTTFARRYALPNGGYLIDSPGMQAFGLAHIPEDELLRCFIELGSLEGECRFRDCRHDAEPGCAINAAVKEKKISLRRFQHFLQIREEITNAQQQRRGW